MGGQESALTPAMERWRERLAAGYTIRPRLRIGRKGQAYLEWGPALYNPAGAFVQNMRRDTLRKLMRLGLLTDGAGAAQGEENARYGDADIGDADIGADNAALGDAQAGDGGWVGGGSEQPRAIVVPTGCGTAAVGSETKGWGD